MPPPGEFTVSLPDLRGFADQVDYLGQVYARLKDDFTHIITDVDGGVAFSTEWTDGGELSGLLSDFVDDFVKLITAEQDACGRLGDGLATTADTLIAAANQYEKQEAQAKSQLEAAGLSDEQEDAAETIVDSVTGGDPNTDWSTRVSLAKLEGLKPGSTAYYAHPMTYKDYMSEQEGVYGQLLSGSISGTLSALIVELTGFDPLKEAIKPFTGNWGFLWYMRDFAACAAQVVENMADVLDRGIRAMSAGDWTGPAAESFVDFATSFRKVLTDHVQNLKAVSLMAGDMGDQLDAAGNKIAPMLQTLADIGFSIIESVATWDPLPAIIEIGKQGLDMLMQDCQPIIDCLAGIEDVVNIASTSTSDLAGAADDLDVP